MNYNQKDLINYIIGYFKNINKLEIIDILEDYYSSLSKENILYINGEFIAIKKNKILIFNEINNKLKKIMYSLKTPSVFLNKLEREIIAHRIQSNLHTIFLLIRNQKFLIRIDKLKQLMQETNKYYLFSLKLQNQSKLPKDIILYIKLIRIKIYKVNFIRNTSNIIYLKLNKNFLFDIKEENFPNVIIDKQKFIDKEIFIAYLKEIFLEYFIKTKKYKKINFIFQKYNQKKKIVFINIGAILKENEIKFLQFKFKQMTEYKLEIIKDI